VRGRRYKIIRCPWSRAVEGARRGDRAAHRGIGGHPGDFPVRPGWGCPRSSSASTATPPRCGASSPIRGSGACACPGRTFTAADLRMDCYAGATVCEPGTTEEGRRGRPRLALRHRAGVPRAGEARARETTFNLKRELGPEMSTGIPGGRRPDADRPLRRSAVGHASRRPRCARAAGAALAASLRGLARCGRCHPRLRQPGGGGTTGTWPGWPCCSAGLPDTRLRRGQSTDCAAQASDRRRDRRARHQDRRGRPGGRGRAWRA